MRFCFVVLFVYTVSKSYAEDPGVSGDPQYKGDWRDGFWQASKGKNVVCPDLFAPNVSVSLAKETGWSENNIYPVQVCATINAGLQECPRSEKSYIRLILYNPDASPKFEVNLTEKLTIEDIVLARGVYCVTFKASNISTTCAHQNLKEIRVKAEVVLFADPPLYEELGFIVELHGAPHLLDYHDARVNSNRNPNHTLHSVICTFPNCAVAATQPAIDPSMTERFTIREGEAPKYEEGDGPLTDKMFSVTYFECERKKCPAYYQSIDVTKTTTMAPTESTTTATTTTSEITTTPSVTTKGGVPMGLLIGGGLGGLILVAALIGCAAVTVRRVHRQQAPRALLSILTWEFPEAYTEQRGASMDREDLVRDVSQ